MDTCEKLIKEANLFRVELEKYIQRINEITKENNSDNIFDFKSLFNLELTKYITYKKVDDGIVCDFILLKDDSVIFKSLFNSKNKVRFFNKVYFIESYNGTYFEKDTVSYTDVKLVELR